MNSAARILIADDQTDVLEALRLLLKGEGYRTETVNAPAKTLAAVEGGEFDVVLMDLNYARDTTSGQEGLDLLARIQALDSALPVVVMTAWANVDLAVEAMRRGARDFVQKPWDNARLAAIIRNQVELGKALRKGQRLEAENELLRGGGPAQAVVDGLPFGSVRQGFHHDPARPFFIATVQLGVNGAGERLGLARDHADTAEIRG